MRRLLTNHRAPDLIPSQALAIHFAAISRHSYGTLTDHGLICGRCGACLNGNDWMNTRCPGPRGEPDHAR